MQVLFSYIVAVRSRLVVRLKFNKQKWVSDNFVNQNLFGTGGYRIRELMDDLTPGRGMLTSS